MLTKLKLPTINTTINVDISEKDLQEAGPSGVNTKTTSEKTEIILNPVEEVVSQPQTDLNTSGTLALGKDLFVAK